MGLLKSVNDAPGIDYYEYRDSQYYNKYEYRVRFKLPGVRYTWWCKTPEDLDKKLNPKTKKRDYTNVKKEDVSEVTENINGLKAIIEIRDNRKKTKDYSIRIDQNTVAIFSNDLSALKALESKIGNYQYDYTQVQTSEYAGIKHFVDEPKHKYRVYLKSKRVGEGFHKELRELIKKTPSLWPSNALNQWLTQSNSWRSQWSSSSHFIDYDNESTLSYLALMYGEMLGKKYKLEKRPEE